MHLRLPSLAPHSRGFTLIELLIAVVIFAFLILLAGPMYSDFIANSRIRNAGESVLNGVRLAQAQAVKRNTPAWFVLDPATGWTVHAPDIDDASDETVETYAFATQGAVKATITPNVGATRVTFDGLGRILANADASVTLTRVDFSNPDISSPRNLRLVINSSGSGTKLCDPALVSTDPAGCP